MYAMEYIRNIQIYKLYQCYQLVLFQIAAEQGSIVS